MTGQTGTVHQARYCAACGYTAAPALLKCPQCGSRAFTAEPPAAGATAATAIPAPTSRPATYCAACGERVMPTVLKCPKCGGGAFAATPAVAPGTSPATASPVPRPVKYCQTCGLSAAATAATCARCGGGRFAASPPARAWYRSWAVQAAAAALLLVGLGVGIDALWLRPPSSAAPDVRAGPVKRAPGGRDAPSAADLVPLLENATVLVLAPIRNGGRLELNAGTGFFVTSDMIVTSNHVIAGAFDRRVFLVSRKLGTVIEGTVIAAVGGGRPTPGRPDFAVVRVAGTMPAHIKPLRLSVEPSPLKEVVAAGYPAAIVITDANWIELVRGDPGKAPELIVTRGHVSAVQNRETGVPLMPHTASISVGNSGGPLVDMCGRVVGINTFSSHTGAGAGGLFALGATGLATFLRANNVPFDWASAACAN